MKRVHGRVRWRNEIAGRMRSRGVVLRIVVAFAFLGIPVVMAAQMGTPTPLSPAERKKAEAERAATGPVANYPQLVDITKSTGIVLRSQVES